MEGAGIWDELPCVIVKGIANYADGHRNADSNWQHFAAATAAATARALIERYPKTDRPRPPLVILKRPKERTKEENECLRDMHVTDPALDKKRIEDTNGGLLKDSYIWILSNADFTQWRNNPGGGLLWIKGDPGKGKTMLICGLIDELQADGIAQPYYFFCQASDPRLNSATKVLCSLVYSIACQDQEALSVVMEKYKHAGRELFNNANTWTALSQMLTQILQKVNLENNVFIIDGLDECITDLHLLVDFIAGAPALSTAKWIVSSRNWSNIEEKLNTSSKKLLLSLELNEQSISHAVQAYIKHKVDQLAALKKLDEHSRDGVEAYLSANANETFLWVALVYKELFKGNVKKRHLQDLMNTFPPELGPLYMRMMAQVCESRDADTCVQVLELISLTYRPISVVELASLVKIPDDNDDFDEMRDVIATCGSFLVLKDDMVYFIHQSAKDFLLSNASDQIFTRGVARKHHDIFSGSIQILSQGLRRDIYKLRHPGARPSVPNPDPLAPLQYACVYWADHLRDADINSSGKTISQASLQDDGVVHFFLKAFLIYWLEALCLTGKLSEGIIAIRLLESLVRQTISTAQDLGLLHLFVRDARRFVLSFRPAIEYTPLQLYSSALHFAPTSSIVRQTFEPSQAKWISQKPSVRFEWDAHLQTLEGHKNDVCSLVFSPDNTKLASNSEDGNVRMWDRATGACLQSLTLDTIDTHTSMAFSPDSSQLALAFDEIIKILDIKTGAFVMTLENGPRHKSMVFSPDGKQLISSNKLWESGRFRIWDLATGMRLRTKDYYRDVRKPAFSESKATDPGIIYILDAATDKCLQRFRDHPVTEQLALSPDGSQLAMAPKHKYTTVRDVKTGASLFTFLSYTAASISPIFSPDGAELAVVGYFENINIWDLTPGSFVDPEKDIIWSLAFSPDNTRFALITNCVELLGAFTIEIWDPVEGKCQQQLQVGKSIAGSTTQSSDIARLAFSPDNTQLAYSRRNELVIRNLAENSQRDKFEFRASGSIQSIVFSPDGTRLAVADVPLLDEIGDTKTLKIKTPKIEIVDATNGAIVHTINFSTGIIDVYFSSDSKRLGSVSEKGIAAICDLNTGACLQTFDFKFGDMRIDWQEEYLRRSHLQYSVTSMLQDPGSIPSAIFEFDCSGDGSWLLRREEPFLWLPSDYRSMEIGFAGGNIAISPPLVGIVLISLSLAELDAEMASNRSSILKV
ncbi:hypothetical protein TRIATDRAFT_220064 [Trichoderma atroviride IMI 206040]|uniref:NACHT domain-containing protein n=1 Tax=Hypocrea atroviridis (strain ATCC 20476 / IMI 206040) TaxID=452589 RepID=G9NTM5_HYPAI|nr:uncharacterized protein TRIATDRAFT_220064 [Trichoderma atroviride IMI 206040]EHK46065.1 hypothetical protein TRIATDRAFT_220064 [Trichoderma atroviride IMI 206040]